MLLALLASVAAALSPASRVALQAGECAAALADPAGPVSDAEKLAVARCRAARADVTGAVALLSGLTEGPLGPYARLVAAEALLARGEAADAAQRLDGIQLPGPAGQRAVFLRGQALVLSGRYPEGKAVLNGLLQGPAGKPGARAEPGGVDPAEIRWWLAEGAVRRGEPAAAVPVWEKLWSGHPTSPRAAEAAVRLAAAGRPVPDTTTDAGRALVRARIAALDDAALYPEALALRDRLPPPSSPEAKAALARACFRGKDYARAARLWAELPTLSPQDRFDRALATARAGDYAAAAALYDAFRVALPGHALADTASFKVPYMAWDSGKDAEAIAGFRAHLQRYPSSRHADEARWFIAWSLVRTGQDAAARPALAEVVSRHPDSALAPVARYWLARLNARQGDAAAAKAGDAEILRRWPTSGAAWFSARALGTTFRAAPVPPLPAVPDSLAGQAFPRGVELAAVGLDAWARAELLPLRERVAGGAEAGRLHLARALVDAGAYAEARALARSSGACGAPGRDDAAWRPVCTPRPLATRLLPEARAVGLDPHLPYAIMMAESGFRPEVTSPVGARGLMQIMPDLGATLFALRSPDEPFHPDVLYRPGVAANLGSLELIRLHRRFQGSRVQPALPLVIAGYNAGLAAVERWEGAATDPAGDRFAEDISFAETRRYVRTVLGHLMAWRMAWGDDPG